MWSPTLRSCPVSSGVDVAESLQATSSVNSETSSLASESINSFCSGIGQMLQMNEDEALKIILAKHTITEPVTTTNEHKSEEKNNSDDNHAPPLGNSLSKQSGWSFDQNQISNDSNESLESAKIKTDDIEAEPEQSMENSFNALIQSYNMFSTALDVKEVLQEFETSNVSEKMNIHLMKTETVVLATQIGRIAREKGLDVQNFECATCRHPLGLSHKLKLGVIAI